MAAESRFERDLIAELQEVFPGAIILKNDANNLQGFPDRLILFGDKWAAFEVKAFRTARRQPNQEYYIRLLDQMSYASFVYPENKEVFLHELQQALRPRRSARLLIRK